VTRKRCSIEGCNNHVVKGVCVTHGAMQASFEGCIVPSKLKKGGV